MQDKSSLRILREWRVAGMRASRAEAALLDQEVRCLDGLCPPPSELEREDAKRLRANASQLFRAALAEVMRVNEKAAELTANKRRR
jgi:hypothetical protein